MNRKDEDSKFYDTAANILGGVEVILAFAGLLLLSLGLDSEEKMIKALGKDGYIPIKDFKDHPPKRLPQQSA